MGTGVFAIAFSLFVVFSQVDAFGGETEVIHGLSKPALDLRELVRVGPTLEGIESLYHSAKQNAELIADALDGDIYRKRERQLVLTRILYDLILPLGRSISSWDPKQRNEEDQAKLDPVSRDFNAWISEFVLLPSVSQAVINTYWNYAIPDGADRMSAATVMSAMATGPRKDEVRRLLLHPKMGNDTARFEALLECAHRNPKDFTRAVQGEFLKQIDFIRRIKPGQFDSDEEVSGYPFSNASREVSGIFDKISRLEGQWPTEQLIKIARSPRFHDDVRRNAFRALGSRAERFKETAETIGRVAQEIAWDEKQPDVVRQGAVLALTGAKAPDPIVLARTLLGGKQGKILLRAALWDFPTILRTSGHFSPAERASLAPLWERQVESKDPEIFDDALFGLSQLETPGPLPLLKKIYFQAVSNPQKTTCSIAQAIAGCAKGFKDPEKGVAELLDVIENLAELVNENARQCDVDELLEPIREHLNKGGALSSQTAPRLTKVLDRLGKEVGDGNLQKNIKVISRLVLKNQPPPTTTDDRSVPHKARRGHQ